MVEKQPVSVFPRAAIIPKLPHGAEYDKLHELVVEAYCSSPKYRPEKFWAVIAAVSNAERAVCLYLMRRDAITSRGVFRDQLLKLRQTITKFTPVLPDHDGHPPWRQMRAAFTGGDPYADDLSRDGETAKEAEWDQRLHPRQLKGVLTEWTRQIDTLLQSSDGKGRQHAVPERWLVEELGAIWIDIIGAQVKLTNGKDGGPPSGAFVEFVDAAKALIPGTKPSLAGQIKSFATRARAASNGERN